MNGHHSKVSSIYTDSITTRPSTAASSNSTQQPPYRPTYLDYKANGTSTRPSDLQSQSIAQPTHAAPPAPEPTPVVANGVLVFAIANSPAQGLKTYVQTALIRARDVSAVVILGLTKQEQALKQFKVDMYALAGSMSRSLDVQLVALQGWNEEEVRRSVERTVGRGTSNGRNADKTLRGVICDIDMNGLGEVDMLDLEAAELEDAWRRSVGFVHAMARSTISLLRIAGQEDLLPTTILRNAFFITTLGLEKASTGSVNDRAVGALLRNMSSSASNRNITFGSADQLLIPDPEPTPVPAVQKPSLAFVQGYHDSAHQSQDGEESPTKLWAAASSMGYF